MGIIKRTHKALDDPDRARFVLAKRTSEYLRLFHDRRLRAVVAKTIAGVTGFHPYLWYVRRTRPSPVVTPVRDFELFVDPADTGISPSLLVYGDREMTLSDRYAQLLQQLDDPVIFDVGSHIGYYVVLAATSLEGECEIHAFEPAPENYEMLKKNVRLNDVDSCVTTERAAIADEVGQLDLALAARTNSHSLQRASGETARVDAMSLDAYCEREDIDKGGIDVIRIDIEGAEAKALRGCAEIFAAGPPPVCFIEVHPKDLTSNERADIYRTLERYGYDVELAIPESVVASPWPGPYGVSSFDDLMSATRVHGVIAVRRDLIRRTADAPGETITH